MSENKNNKNNNNLKENIKENLSKLLGYDTSPINKESEKNRLSIQIQPEDVIKKLVIDGGSNIFLDVDKEMIKHVASLIEENTQKVAKKLQCDINLIKDKVLPEYSLNENYLEVSDFLDSGIIKKLLKQVEKSFSKESLIRRAGRFTMSQYASECERKILFQYFGLTKIDLSAIGNYPELKLHSILGNVIHDFIQSILNFTIQEHSFTWYLDEEKTIKVNGRIDALYKINSDKFTGGVLLEIKTIKKDKYTQHDFRGLSEHWAQALSYAYVLNELGISQELINDEIKFVQLLYVTKDLEISDDFIMKVDSNAYARQVRYLKRKNQITVDAVKNKKIVPLSSDYLVDISKCNYCPYKSFCKKHIGWINILDEDFSRYFIK